MSELRNYVIQVCRHGEWRTVAEVQTINPDNALAIARQYIRERVRVMRRGVVEYGPTDIRAYFGVKR